MIDYIYQNSFVTRLFQKPEVPGYIYRSGQLLLLLISLIIEGQLSVTGKSMLVQEPKSVATLENTFALPK